MEIFTPKLLPQLVRDEEWLQVALQDLNIVVTINDQDWEVVGYLIEPNSHAPHLGNRLDFGVCPVGQYDQGVRIGPILSTRLLRQHRGDGATLHLYVLGELKAPFVNWYQRTNRHS